MSDHPADPRARAPSPFRLDLGQQRRRAKELLRAFRAGEDAAIRRFALHHPRAATAAAPPRLADAQHALARELGLASWPRLKAHIAAMERSWARIGGVGEAPDGGADTLHIRCGSDISPALQEAGFRGGFLEYSNPLCQGPVTGGPDWLDRRADFILHAYGAGSGMDRAAIEAKLRAGEEGLAAAARHDRVVLWFERDSYDQLILARCLAQFAEKPPRRLELVCPERYPGATRFIGLGQLPPEALRLLWEERVPVTAAAIRAGEEAWNALRLPDPRPLAALAAGTPALPPLGPALRRHLQELPWTTDGLGLTQRLVLRRLADGPATAAQVFHHLMMESEPLPWLTDLMFHDVVEGLRSPQRPVVEGRHDAPGGPWPLEHLSLTPLGRAVLAGETYFLSLRPAPRWVGGVRLRPGAPGWRWDEAAGAALPSP